MSFFECQIKSWLSHMVRNSTKFVSHKDLKKVCADLKTIYSAATEEAGLEALMKFGEKWDAKYPMISQSWQRHWDDLSEFFKYPPEIRRAIYTTNAVESLNYQLRKVTKTARHFVRTMLYSRYCTWRFATCRKNGRGW